MAVQVLLDEVDQTVAGGLRTSQRSAVREALARENAGPLVGQALVLTEHVADLACAGSDVASRNVGVGADVLHELGHEALAEAHDLHVGLALRVEVRTALAAAHGQRGEAVLEHLLEAQELEDAQVDGRMQANAALVRADGAVELDAEAAVHLDLAFVVYPRNAELDDALRFDHALEQGQLAVLLLVRLDNHAQRLQDLGYGLDEFWLLGILLLDALDDVVYVGHAFSPLP